MHVLAWLQLGRIQTASGTMSIVLLGYLLGGGDLLGVRTVLWLLFGFLVHYVGHMDNSIADYKYDKDDPSKSHFPLVSGVIYYTKSVVIAEILGILLFPAIVVVMLYGYPAAQLTVALSFGFGVLYNRINKTSVYKPVPIALTFSLLLFVSFLTESTLLNPIVALLFVYIFLTMFFEQGYGGELKDIEHDKVSLLRKMGAEVRDGYFLPTVKVDLFAIALLLGKSMVGVSIMLMAWSDYEGYFFGLGVMIILVLMMGYLTRSLVEPRKWDVVEREKSIRNLSLLEMVTYFLGLLAVAPVIGLIQVIVLAAFVPVWFIVMNRVVWKTFLHPRV